MGGAVGSKVVRAAVVLAALGVLLVPASSVPQGGGTVAISAGETATRLATGHWLIAGGWAADGPTKTLRLVDPHTGTTSVVPGGLIESRAGHTATLLPDGTVLVFGGVGRDGHITATVERFRSDSGTVEAVATPGLMPRAHHTATLLTDGRVLLVGGVTNAQGARSDGQLWDPRSGTASPPIAVLSIPRQGHRARLLPDGSLLISGGLGPDGRELTDSEGFDPTTGPVSAVQPSGVDGGRRPLTIEVSMPADGAVDVPLDAFVVFRFSSAPRLTSVNTQTVTLAGPSGPEAAIVVPAEGGILLFVTPRAPLRPGTTYTVSLDGVTDGEDMAMLRVAIQFTTLGIRIGGAPESTTATTSGSELASQPAGEPPVAGNELDDEGGAWEGERRDGRPYSRWQALPPLQAGPGVTALAGQVLRLNGEPLPRVTLMIQPPGTGAVRTQTDDSGRFLLPYVGAGHQELVIDGHSAGPRGRRYGVFEVGVDLRAEVTNVLPYTIWLPALDTAHAVTIASPTTDEVVVTTPRIPGLEVRLPPGTVIRDRDGQVVREVGITPIPLDRTPFPLPAGVDVPFYFTVQPGASYLSNAWYRGARLIYPSTDRILPGTRVNFWNYDAGGRGWYVYGLGTAMPDDGGIVPDPRVFVYEFTGAMVAGAGFKPAQGSPAGSNGKDGDPVDLATGLFVLEKTDLLIPDIIAIVLRRTYRPGDTIARAFGLGASHPYDMFLVGDTFPYTYMDLVLPDGGSIHFTRISPGTSFADAVYETSASPTRFYKSRIAWDGVQFFLTTTDGTVYTFREAFGATRPMQGGLIAIRDRLGNSLSISRDANADIVQITSPGGRWVRFSYDASHRVTQVRDALSRTVSYTYDAGGRLATVTDPAGGVTTYTYDAANRMATLRDARGILFLTNEYDSTGKVTRQTQADGTTYQFAYTLGAGGKVTQTDVTDPRGFVRRVTFNGDGYIMTDTRAFGTPLARAIAYERQLGSNLATAITDALGRRMEWTYDAKGNPLTVTRLAATANAVTTTFTYEPAFSQLASVTDALNHTTTFGYDGQGNLTSVTDPLSHVTTIGRNPFGQPVSVTDPLNATTTLTYDSTTRALAGVTDSLGQSTTRAYDSVGRMVAQSDPQGVSTSLVYDPLNRITKVLDASLGATQFSYDANGNRLSLTDARGSTTAYTYDGMDRPATRTDPLLRVESYSYDANGNVTTFTDRKGQVTSRTYDALDRLSQVTYADGATTSYTRDAGNRLTQVVDSVSGTITRSYDNLDRLTQETTPQGTVSYAYDAAGRRTSMTVAGQPTVTYTYDNADRLTQIAQGTSSVTLAYDAAGRRISLALPNAVVTEYAYDAASRVTSLTYRQGTTTLGTLTYTYDAVGNRTLVGGTWARTGLPAAIGSATYNTNNQQLTFGAQTLTYDLHGNLTSDGTKTYTWDARNRLTAITGPGLTASFQYDPVGRRMRKVMNGVPTDFLYDGLNPGPGNRGRQRRGHSSHRSRDRRVLHAHRYDGDGNSPGRRPRVDRRFDGRRSRGADRVHL